MSKPSNHPLVVQCRASGCWVPTVVSQRTCVADCDTSVPHYERWDVAHWVVAARRRYAAARTEVSA